MKFLRLAVMVVVLAILALALWLWLSPPDLVRVATNYSAKTVCSNTFLAGRDSETVLADDVQAPGHPVLKFIRVDTDAAAQTVTARLLGFAAPATAIHRAGLGCTNQHDTPVTPLATSAATDLPAPAPLPTAINPKLQAIVENDALAGPGIRAVVVLKDGTVVAERYASGFDATTPLLGWSMTKTVTAAILGRLEQAGLLSRNDSNLFPHWSDDARARITVADLLGMASDLSWNEGYGSVSDVTRMLYLEPDMAAFVKGAQLETPDGSGIGKSFEYSSGTSVLLSRYWQNKVGPQSVNLPRDTLFQPLGMTSATLEPDAAGTFVGGSNMYATARDWARFGQFLLQDGQWDGARLLPEGYVDWMMEPHPANANGYYARGHLWRAPPRKREERSEPTDPALSGTVWLAGHDGQSVSIDRKAGLVVVRLGLTPGDVGYQPEHLHLALKDALED